jgi:glucose/arabinose dehydrogenase
LRNPIGLAWEPGSGALWTVDNARDEIGSDLVPDYLTSVVRDGFDGWPYSYFGAHVDERVEPGNPGPRRDGSRSRLRARPAHGIAWPRLGWRATC